MKQTITVSKLAKSFFRIIILFIIFCIVITIVLDQIEFTPNTLPIHSNIHQLQPTPNDISGTEKNQSIIYKAKKYDINSDIPLQSSRLLNAEYPSQSVLYDYVSWPCTDTDANDMQYHHLSLPLYQHIKCRESVYNIKYIDNTRQSLCGKRRILQEDINKLIGLIDRGFIYEMWLDELPIYASIGFKIIDHYYLYTHRTFNIYVNNETMIVTANIEVNNDDDRNYIEIIKDNGDLEDVEFTYSVHFLNITNDDHIDDWKTHLLFHAFESNREYMNIIAIYVKGDEIEYFMDINDIATVNDEDIDDVININDDTSNLELPGNLPKVEANYSILSPQELEENGVSWRMNGIYPQLKDVALNKCGDLHKYYTSFDEGDALRYYDKIEIWPIPQKFILFKHSVFIASDVKWIYIDTNDILRSAIHRYNALIFEHRTDNEASLGYKYIKLVIDDLSSLNLSSMNEWYEVIIAYPCDTIYIHSKSVFGALRGIETLSQLIYYDFNVNIYFVKYVGYIEDYPYFKYRGVLLDSSRHFHPPSVIKHVIDSISFAKYNVLHWHIVDDESWPFPMSSSYNEYNLSDLYKMASFSKNERYSLYDIKDIIHYANIRGIRIIPEFDVPSHVGSWCKAFDICLDVSCTKGVGVLDPSKPLTFKIVKSVYDEIVSIFNDEYIHIGNDETNYQCYKNNSNLLKWFNENNIKEMPFPVKKRKTANGMKINAFTVTKLFEIFANYNKTLISWDDLYNKVKGIIPNDVILMVWQSRWKKDVVKMLRSGYKLIIAAPFYVDRWYEPLTDRYFADLWPKIENNELKHNIIGGELCLWSEHVDASVIDAKLWPDAAAAAENLWMGPNKIKTLIPLWHYVIKPRLKWYRCKMIERGIGFMQIDIKRKYPNEEFYLREPMYPFSCINEFDVRPIEQILPDNNTRKPRRNRNIKHHQQMINNDVIINKKNDEKKNRNNKRSVIRWIIALLCGGLVVIVVLIQCLVSFDSKHKSF